MECVSCLYHLTTPTGEHLAHGGCHWQFCLTLLPERRFGRLGIIASMHYAALRKRTLLASD
jgi:hypothetical protein